MKCLRWVIAAAGIGLALPVHAATTDPLIIIYRVSGVADNGGGAGAGVATVVRCTNISSVTELITFVVRNFNSNIVANQSFNVPSFQTLTVSTHFTNLFANATLSPGTSVNGTLGIAATSINIFCSTLLVDAAASVPSGVQLPMVRFSPMPNSQE